MQTQPTSGPWHYETADGFCGEIVDADGDCVATFVDDPSDQNVMLLTAAPDLLEALKALLERYVLAIGNEGIECLNARAAIAKATGEQQ